MAHSWLQVSLLFPFFFLFITAYNFASNFGLSSAPRASTFASRYVRESCSNMQTETELGLKASIRNIRVLNSTVKLLRPPLPSAPLFSRPAVQYFSLLLVLYIFIYIYASYLSPVDSIFFIKPWPALIIFAVHLLCSGAVSPVCDQQRVIAIFSSNIAIN